MKKYYFPGKIPMVPGSAEFVKLYTTKLGTKRFLVPPDAEFDLSNPCYASHGYNFLHDPHLNEYLNNPSVKKTLVGTFFVWEIGGFLHWQPEKKSEKSEKQNETISDHTHTLQGGRVPKAETTVCLKISCGSELKMGSKIPRAGKTRSAL